MNLLVTGGAGFIGSNFIHSFVDNPAVDLLVNFDALTYAGRLSNLSDYISDHHPKYVFEHGDLCDAAHIRRVIQQREITHIVHFAAESHVDRSIDSPGDFITTNVNGTFNLLESARHTWGQSGGFEGKRFVHVSTDEVFGALGKHDFPFTERTKYAPNSPYSASKASSDMLVRSYYHTYKLPVMITNCSNNYGPRQYPEKLIPVVINRILNNQPIPVYGNGDNVRDWIHVDDHNRAIWQVLTNGRNGESYCIGADKEISNLDLVCEIGSHMVDMGIQSSSKIKLVTDRQGHDFRYAIDSRKIKRELGWRATVNFQDGLKETIKWYIEANKHVIGAMVQG